jgi:hypothetical protein
MEAFEQGGERAELFVLDAGSEFVYYPYLLRSLDGLSFGEDSTVDLDEFCDVVSSWYYGGPLLSNESGEASDLTEAFATAFSEYCVETGIVAEFVRFDPNLANHETFACLGPTFERETVPVDLTQTADEIWEGLEGRNQRAINQALDTDLQVAPSQDPIDIAAFHDIYTNAMEARDASAHYRFDLSFFERILETELFSLVIARYHGEVVGGFVIAQNDRIAHHYLSASDPDYWDMRVNNLLCYTSLMEMRDRGLEIFDFQGGRPGVFRFKKGFSPDRLEFHVGKRIHLPEVYGQLTKEADRAGIDTSGGYFPAYRVATSN